VSLQVADMAVAPMQIKNALVTSLQVCAVCLLFDFCMAAGAALSGLNRAAQQSGPAPGRVCCSPAHFFSVRRGERVLLDSSLKVAWLDAGKRNVSGDLWNFYGCYAG